MQNSRIRTANNFLCGLFATSLVALAFLSADEPDKMAAVRNQIRQRVPIPQPNRPVIGPVPTCIANGAGPSNGEIDDAVCKVMTANHVQGASLAIVYGTKLVYARGYTNAPLGTPAIQPTTLFRQASVSKLVTALAIFQLIEENSLSLDTKMQDVLHITQHNGLPPKDPRFNTITVRNLLEMDSGIDSNIMWNDPQIAAALHVQLPLSAKDAEQYAASEMLDYAPGTAAKATYDNTNYSFLGDIVAAKRNANSLADAIVTPLLKPLSITRIRTSRSLKADQLPDEAPYLKLPPGTDASVMTQAQPQVPIGYGDWNLERGQGAGGLSAAATDMARILAMMNVEVGNPAFKNFQTIVDMMNDSFKCFHGPTPVAHGYYGFDGMESRITPGVMPPTGDYFAQKGGELNSSQNGIYFEHEGLSYVLNWAGMTPTGPSWYPLYGAIYSAATKPNIWDNTPDQFPIYNMPSMPVFKLNIHPNVPNLKPLSMDFLGKPR